MGGNLDMFKIELSPLCVPYLRHSIIAIQLMAKTTHQATSRRMALVHSVNTKTEMAVRRLVHSMGYRYRLHRRDLPGTPDLVFPSRRAAVFVHGCFWHHHKGCPRATMPKSNTEFWTNKLERNRARDVRNLVALEADGWRVLTVWECELKDMKALTEKLRGFLN